MKERNEAEQSRIFLQEILSRLEAVKCELHQDTNDVAQLNPCERLTSIQKVWDSCKGELGEVHDAIDAGSGFGYGTVFLETEGINTIGVENVGKKIQQGQELFQGAGITIPKIDKLDFNQAPAFIESDFNSIEGDSSADLISMFYLSLKMIDEKATFETCKRLLKEGGKLLLSTQAPAKEVAAWAEANAVNFSYKIIEVPGNFEQTAVIIDFKK